MNSKSIRLFVSLKSVILTNGFLPNDQNGIDEYKAGENVINKNFRKEFLEAFE